MHGPERNNNGHGAHGDRRQLRALEKNRPISLVFARTRDRDWELEMKTAKDLKKAG